MCFQINKGAFVGEWIPHLGSMLTNDGRYTYEIKSKIVMEKAAFNKKKPLFTSTLDLKLGIN